MQEIENIFAESDLQLTQDIAHSIYLLPSGEGVDGEFDYGSRGLDHRAIEQVTPIDRYHPDFWDYVHFNLGLVRIVPETETALIRANQTLTQAQAKAIDALNYTIETY